MNALARDLKPEPAEHGAIWRKNGGLYFGYEVEPPPNAERPLDGKEKLPRAPRSAPVKTAWRLQAIENVYTADRHVLTIGPNGSGKSRKLLLPNLLRLTDWSIVVIDPKGELAAHTAAYRASFPGHQVRVIDPFELIPKTYPALYEKHRDILTSKGFNPVASLDPKADTFVDDAKTIASALISTDDARDPYWSMAAQQLIKGLILANRLAAGRAASLGALRDFFADSNEEAAATIRRLIRAYKGECPEMAVALSEFQEYSSADRESAGVRRQAKVQTDWIGSAKMRRDLSGDAYSFAAMKETPTTVYLVIPPEFLVTHGVWLRLMITSILLPLLRSSEQAKCPVLFMLDEFAQLGPLKVVMDNYALMRGFGVKLWTIWQDLSQAKRLYNEQWESLISNSGVTQAFAPQDLTTRDYLSRLFGERIIWHDKGSTSWGLSKGGINLGGSGSQVHINERVLKPHELAALDADESVMHIRGGEYRLGVLPQPEQLTRPFDGMGKSVAQLLAEARAAISDNPA